MKTVYKKADEIKRREYDKALRSPISYGTAKKVPYLAGPWSIGVSKTARVIYSGLHK